MRLGVNLDGSVVVGAVDGEAAIWNRSGLHSVATSLEEHGIALPGGSWQLLSANGVTPDGQTIVGVPSRRTDWRPPGSRWFR
jgi:hypothetical protein